MFLALVITLRSPNGLCMSWWQLVKLIQSTFCRCGPTAIWTLAWSYKIPQWQYKTFILILMMRQMWLDADKSAMTKSHTLTNSLKPATVSITLKKIKNFGHPSVHSKKCFAGQIKLNHNQPFTALNPLCPHGNLWATERGGTKGTSRDSRLIRTSRNKQLDGRNNTVGSA